jgi:hypothetical protein
MDRITNFQSGTDKIVLTALSASSATSTQHSDASNGAPYTLLSVPVNGATLVVRIDGGVAKSDLVGLVPGAATEGAT